MVEAVQVLWSPVGADMPSLGARALVDVTDGDTPNLRMPVRMLSVDTPEVTARTEQRAGAINEELKQLASWIRQGIAPVPDALAAHLLPKLETGAAGTLQFRQGLAASAFGKENIARRLKRPDGRNRNIFIRVADSPFDTNGRLLAYVAPDYSAKERDEIPKAERPTFNLDLVTGGWAAPFVLFPSIPGPTDLALLVAAGAAAREAGLGIWSDPATLLAYEYRAVEKLFRVTRKIAEHEKLQPGEAYSWRERYCADMRDRTLHGPDGYVVVPPEYRLFVWPADLRQAISMLNLVPAPDLTGAR